MASADNRGSEPAKRLAVELDGETRDILSELVHGERHTTYLQDSTGVKRQKLHRRLDRLEEDGVIDTEKKKPQSGGQARRHARLTDHGEDLIDDGLLESITDTNQNVETLQQQLDELQTDVRKELSRRPSEYEAKEIAERKVSKMRTDLEEEIHQLRKEINHLEADTERARELAEEADTDVADAVEALEARVKALEETTARTERRVESFDERLEALESGRSPETRDRQIDALLALVSRLAIQGDVIGERLEEAETTAREANQTADRATEMVRDETKDLGQNLAELRDDHSGRLADAETRLEALSSEIDGLADEQLEADIEEVRSAVIELWERQYKADIQEVKNNRESKDGGWLF